ncbi:hypothetical protein RSSE_c3384 [Ralstonia solanacearum]|nr:hypothetical protein RSSE_c3384 [Ralstonia solanacearum]
MPGLIVKRDGRPQPLEAVRHTWVPAKEKGSRRSLFPDAAACASAPMSPAVAVIPAVARPPAVPARGHHNRRRAVVDRCRRVIHRRRRRCVVDRRRRRIIHRGRGHVHRRKRDPDADPDAHARRRCLWHGQHGQCGGSCHQQPIASIHLHHLRLDWPDTPD